mgnify:CR=1 FL=1
MAYEDALMKAAGAYATQAKLDAKRKAEANPLYKVGQVLEPVGQLADVGLSLAGLPPVAGAIGSGIKQIGGGLAGVEGADAVGGATGMAKAGASFMKWKRASDENKKMDDLLKLFQGSETAVDPDQVTTSAAKMDALIDSISSNYE